MWIFPVGRLCVAQEPKYGDSPLGRWVVGGITKVASPEFTRCAREREWIPEDICAELMSLQPEAGLSRSNLERLGARWSAQLKVLQVAGPYVMDSAEAERQGREIPPCP